MRMARADTRGFCRLAAEKCAKPHEAMLPLLATSRTLHVKEFGPVVGVWVLSHTIGVMGGIGAEEVEVDAVHGFRPNLRKPCQNARKPAILIIRKILGTKVELTFCGGVIFPLCLCSARLTRPRNTAASPKPGGC